MGRATAIVPSNLDGRDLYGLISFLVAERMREIGARIALGATPGAVAKMVVRDGVRWTGVIVGIAASADVPRLLEGLLHEVTAMDPQVLAGAMAVLVGVTILAAWLPAVRPSRSDPLTALRHE